MERHGSRKRVSRNYRPSCASPTTRRSSATPHPTATTFLLFLVLLCSAGAAASPSPASPTTTIKKSVSFAFSPCVQNRCIGDTGCGTNNPPCMCRAARGGFLDSVLVCMFYQCPGDLRADAHATFLDPIARGCADLGNPVPDAALNEADGALAGLLRRLPSSPAGTSAPEETARLPPSQSTSAPSTTSTSTTSSSSRRTSSTGTGTLSAAESSSTTTTTTRASSQATLPPPSSSPEPATTSSSSSSSSSSSISSSATRTKGTHHADPTDSSPFATGPDGAAGILVPPYASSAAYLWAALSVAAVVVVMG
ncbi:hypothetical protein VTK73DRAFT_6756 [Phialemonium thermophilum]|uniref:Extracellular membrane protein CFEM domain-containing protein n=1 Tax=Phialemonium thermophilum TaxID=223376 RepID=A0ABR3WI85_9PEZI